MIMNSLDRDVITRSVTSSDISSVSNVKTERGPGGSKAPFCGFGIFCGIMAGLVYSFNTLLVKMIESSEAFQLSASRCAVQALLLVPYATYNWRRNSVDIMGSPKMLKFLILRALTGSTSSIFLYQAIQRISVGDAVTLQFTSMIFAAILAYFFLKEHLALVQCIMIILTLVGVTLISKPTFIFGENDKLDAGILLAGVAFGLASGLFNGSTLVVLRLLGMQRIDPSLNILYYSLVGAGTSSILVIATGSFRIPCLHELPYITLLGITGIGGQIFMTLGLQYERAAVFPAIRSLQIVFVYILQITVLQDQPSLLSAIGSSCIFICVVGFSLHKLYRAMKAEKQS